MNFPKNICHSVPYFNITNGLFPCNEQEKGNDQTKEKGFSIRPQLIYILGQMDLALSGENF